MTQLIVRPIDDDRYSKENQAAYILLLKDYNYDLYKIESAKFAVRHYSQSIAKAAQAFGELFIAFDDALTATIKSFVSQIKRGINDNRRL